ncbi:MAG TPA: hypothetical protein VHO71_00640 [Caproiciproducens sp.]|nr:hypothetical protein [Caproiciproducens sp.]
MKIKIQVKALKEKLLELEHDDMYTAELEIVEGQVDRGNIFPAFLHIDGISKTGGGKDYESIDEFSPVESFKIHKSA